MNEQMNKELLEKCYCVLENNSRKSIMLDFNVSEHKR